jgi:hypothetical protein
LNVVPYFLAISTTSRLNHPEAFMNGALPASGFFRVFSLCDMVDRGWQDNLITLALDDQSGHSIFANASLLSICQGTLQAKCRLSIF